jgi:hypothetical protein
VKPPKPLKASHTPNTKYGLGDFYGSGLRAPLGKMREGVGMVQVSKKGLKKPPKSLA